MRTDARTRVMLSVAVLIFLAFSGSAGRLSAKDKGRQINANDPTVRLFSLLDAKFNGKVDDLCMLADVVNDPKNPGQSLQRVLRIEYDKARAFGKLRIYVRTVAKLTPAQLKTYTPKQIYDFAETDSAKFTKSDLGSFGQPGDVYFEPSSDGGPLASASVTPEVQTLYENLVTNYLIPGLEKKAEAGSGS